MDIFLDTNILIDYLQERKPFFESVNKLIELCRTPKLRGYVSAQSIADAFYILRKDYSVQQRKNLLNGLCKMFYIIGADKKMLINALTNEDFTDFEDCLQSECAQDAGVDFIVTRNIKDFIHSPIPAIFPEDFLKTINETR